MLISNVRIVNPDCTIANADIMLDPPYITKILPKQGIGNTTIIPGFIDPHIHGFYGYDVMEDANALQTISYQLAKHGTTAFCPTIMTQAWEKILIALQTISSFNNWTAKNIGIHMEGPFLGLAKKGAHQAQYLQTLTPAKLQTLTQAAAGQIKKITFDPDVVSISMQQALLAADILPSLGHSNTTLAHANQYFATGCTAVCHLWNAMSGVDSRNPGLTQAALMHPAVYCELIVDQIHLSDATVKFTIQTKGVSKIMCISDAIKPAYGCDGQSVSGGLAVYKVGKHIYLENTAKIAGSGITMHDAYCHLLALGINVNEAVQMTSTNAAHHFGLTKQGYVQSGYYADLVQLDNNNQIVAVYVNGTLVQ